jgi:hypothetical protein
MYVNTISRHLGDVRPDLLSSACRPLWARYKLAKGPNFPRIWEAFVAENPACRRGSEIRYGYQPSVNPCGDAQSGLLIDCWNRALQTGLSGFGRGSLGQSQAELDVLSRWHQQVTHPKEIHPYPVTRHRRRSSQCQCGLGQDDVLDEGSAWGSGGSDPIAPNISIPASPMPSLPADTIPLPTYTGPTFGPFPGQGGVATVAQNQAQIASSPAALITPLSNLATSFAKIFTPATPATKATPAAKATAAGSSLSLGGISPTLLLGGLGVLLLFVIVSGGRR